MLALALPALNFLRGNWTWAVPWALVAAVGLYAGIQRMEVLSLKTAAATFAAKANEAALAYRAKDQENGARLAGQYAAEVAGLQEKYENAQGKLAAVANTAACDHTPASAVFDAGLLDEAGSADSGAKRP